MNRGEACTFAIEVRRSDGALAGVSDASTSICIDDAWFRGVQAGRLPNGGELPALRVVPTWHDAQRPAVTGLSISLDGGPLRHYPRDVFWPQARALIQRLRGEGRVADREKLEWSVIACEEVVEGPPDAPRTERAPFPFEPAALPHVAAGSFEICLGAELLRRLRDRIRRSGTVEGATPGGEGGHWIEGEVRARAARTPGLEVERVHQLELQRVARRVVAKVSHQQLSALHGAAASDAVAQAPQQPGVKADLVVSDGDVGQCGRLEREGRALCACGSGRTLRRLLARDHAPLHFLTVGDAALADESLNQGPGLSPEDVARVVAQGAAVQ